MHSRLTGKEVWPVRVTTEMMRRKRAEPPRDSEVKVHLVKVRLTPAQINKREREGCYLHFPFLLSLQASEYTLYL